MPSSTVSVCNEPDDFRAALGWAGENMLVVTTGGQFRAKAARVVLHHVSATFVQEQLPRVAFVAPPADTVRVLMPAAKSEIVHGGIRVRSGEISTHRAGAAAHEMLAGPAQWRDIVLSGRFLQRYGGALLGGPVGVPTGVRLWRPSPQALRRLTALHAAATRLAEMRPGSAADNEAARGFEQELVMILVECLSGGAAEAVPAARSPDGEIMRRFEAVLGRRLEGPLSMRDICARLGVANSTLRAACHRHIGMPPQRYIRLRRMQSVRRALRSEGGAGVSVAAVARQHGFREAGHFSQDYRSLFDELPSETLRRSMGH